jgi:cob(I)alamin adenosyltransferase
MQTTGLVHIYTGEGKGKTTSAVGLCLRALGHGLKVCYTYFHKQPEKYGYTEIKNLEKLGATVYGFAKGHPFCDSTIKSGDLLVQAPAGIDFLKSLIQTEHFDLMVLDEIIISVRDGYLPEKTLLDFVLLKPADMELVLTGRGATPGMIELADYVSRIEKVKHPYDCKITSRKGIEY